MSKQQARERESTATKRQQQLKERRKRGKARNRRKQASSMIAIAVGAVLLVGALIYPSLKPLDIAFPPLVEHPMANGNSMGDPNAPVHVIEYANFTCSHCANFVLDSEPMIIEEYIKTGKVYFTYIPYVGLQDPEGFRAAEAAFCAADQGRFWDMHDVIFSNFDFYIQNRGFSRRSLDTMAETLGLDMDTFGTCMDDNVKRDAILNLATAGSQAGISVTPSFFINGVSVIGDDPQSIIREIELALALINE
jgi:protein-disulfide isomerase